eukprot:jgi/Mesvir1/1617/Mv05059-RA.1
MQEPVMLVETGQIYERSLIEQWFSRGNDTDPLSNRTVADRKLVPVLALRSLIEEWTEQQERRWAKQLSRRQRLDAVSTGLGDSAPRASQEGLAAVPAGAQVGDGGAPSQGDAEALLQGPRLLVTPPVGDPAVKAKMKELKAELRMLKRLKSLAALEDGAGASNSRDGRGLADLRRVDASVNKGKGSQAPTGAAASAAGAATPAGLRHGTDASTSVAAAPLFPLLVDELWTQCDACAKWRPLPPCAAMPEVDKWSCHQYEYL